MTRLGLATIALGALLAGGCSAQLRDGVYGCADGRCPSGFVCWSDGRCHTTPEPPDSGTPPNDAFVPLIDMGIGPVDMGMPGNDAGGGCTGTTMGPCSGIQACAIGNWSEPPGMPTYGCAGPTEVGNSAHGNMCTPGPTSGCRIPDACIMSTAGNRCMRPCFPGSQCQFGEDCVSAGGAMVCARPCGAPPTCPMFMFTCSAGHCLPSGW